MRGLTLYFNSLRDLRHPYRLTSYPLRYSSHVKSSTPIKNECLVAARGKPVPHITAVSGFWNRSHPITSLRYNSSQSGTSMSSTDVKKAVDNISGQFTEAMELLNDARSSSGTVYFSEDMEDAQKQVTDTLQSYTDLLGKLNEQQKKSVIQSVGLKMEELKSQLSLLEELLRE